MNTQVSNRVAHVSSVAVSFIVNALLILGILYFVKNKEVAPPPGTVIKYVIEVPDEGTTFSAPLDVPPIDDPKTDKPNVDSIPEIPFPDTKVRWGSDEQEPQSISQPTQSLAPIVTQNTGIVTIPGLYFGRTEKAKKAALKEVGSMGRASEASVQNALDWLRDHQQESGSWNKTGTSHGGENSGYTGLALLAFLSNGETPASKDYGGTVAKAIRFLVKHQDSGGVLRPAGSHTVYGHAIATYALAEAYIMTGNPLLHGPLDRAVQVILNGRMSNGGYDYDYKQENRNDLSVGAWHVQALKAVMVSPVGNKEIEQALQASMEGMLQGSKIVKKGGRGFTYTVHETEVGAPRHIISAAGTLGLFMTGRAKRRECREAIDFMKQFTKGDQLPEWNPSNPQNEHGGEIMLWYYASQAFFQENPKGRNFKRFASAMVKALVENQASDGHWLGYSEKAQHQGPVFNTTLGAMSLMVFYRYGRGNLPTMMKRDQPKSEPSDGGEEIVFEI